MKLSQLETIAQNHGLNVDTARNTNGKFHVIEIGTGANLDNLLACKRSLIEAGFNGLNSIQRVSNPDHPQHNLPYLELEFFWAE